MNPYSWVLSSRYLLLRFGTHFRDCDCHTDFWLCLRRLVATYCSCYQSRSWGICFTGNGRCPWNWTWMWKNLSQSSHYGICSVCIHQGRIIVSMKLLHISIPGCFFIMTRWFDGHICSSWMMNLDPAFLKLSTQCLECKAASDMIEITRWDFIFAYRIGILFGPYHYCYFSWYWLHQILIHMQSHWSTIKSAELMINW